MINSLKVKQINDDLMLTFTRIRSQSAMEYLMTYGWAILIIAIAMSALFALGVFNPSSFGPKASPGSCKVLRPDGPYTLSFISISGLCNGEPPRYVSYSTGQQLVVNHEFFQGQSFTILAWIYWPSSLDLANPGTSNGDLGYAWSGSGATSDEGFGIFSRSDHWYLNFYGDDLECSDGPSTGKWYLFGASWNNATKQQTIWVNGVANCTRTSNGDLVTNEPLYLLDSAGTWDSGAYADGYVTNIQLYNTALSANQIMAIYQAGIGGVPPDLIKIEGWWPLNGNSNDYSGNNNDGSGSINYISNYPSQ
jgi:hypothetical protein